MQDSSVEFPGVSSSQSPYLYFPEVSHLQYFCSSYRSPVAVQNIPSYVQLSKRSKTLGSLYASPCSTLSIPVLHKRRLAPPPECSSPLPHLCTIVLLCLGTSLLCFSLEITSRQKATLISCLFPISQGSHYLKRVVS